MTKHYVIKNYRGREERGSPRYMLVPRRTFGIGSLISGVGTVAFLPFRLAGGVLSAVVPRTYGYAGAARFGMFGMAGQMGSLMALMLLGMLLFNRTYLDQSFPAWEGSIGVAGLMFAAMSLFGSLFGCFRAVGMFVVWLAATLMIGRAVINPTSQLNSYPPVAAEHGGPMDSLYAELEYFQMPSEKNGPVRMAHKGYLQGIRSSIEGTGASVTKAVSDVTSGISKGISDTTESVKREISSGLGTVLEILNLDGTQVGSRLLASVNSHSSTLPEEAFFGRSMRGHKFYSMGGASSGGMDDIVQRFKGVLAR